MGDCRQCSFAEFKVSGVQKAYCDALHSLQLELLAQRRRAAAAHKQQHKQALQLDPQQLHQLTPLGVAAATAASSSNSSSSSSGLCLPVSVGEEALELQLVQLLLGLMYSDLGAGYCEQTLAKMQVGSCLVCCLVGSCWGACLEVCEDLFWCLQSKQGATSCRWTAGLLAAGQAVSLQRATTALKVVNCLRQP